MSERSKPSGATGAGSEAAEGIHGASTDRDPADRSSVEESATSADDDRTALVDRETEHRSGYGGSGGRPVKSSDQRKG
jgi:hypothetical protein